MRSIGPERTVPGALECWEKRQNTVDPKEEERQERLAEELGYRPHAEVMSEISRGGQ